MGKAPSRTRRIRGLRFAAARVIPVLVAVATAASSLPAHAGQDSARGSWSQWRGPDRTGVASVELPADWHASLQPRWRAEVGIGHSSPIVAGERVFQFGRVDDREVLHALELESGRVLWRGGHDVPYTMNPAARGHGKGPKSTPVYSDGRVFTLGIAGALTAWDAGDGTVLWRHDFAGEFSPTGAEFGSAMSPIVLGDRLVAHVGGPAGGALAAFDVATGARVWSNDDHVPAYASPILASLDGVEQLVTQTRSHVLAVDPRDGTELWSIPFTTDYDQNTVTPLVVGDLLLLSGLGRGMFAVRPELRDGAWTTAETWRNESVSLYMSSPVLAAGKVFGMSHRRAGQFFALEPDTGEVLWTSTGREGDNASLVVADGQVLFLDDDAELWVVPVDVGSYDPVARVQVADSPTWAHPVPTGTGLLVKDREHLTLLAF